MEQEFSLITLSVMYKKIVYNYVEKIEHDGRDNRKRELFKKSRSRLK